MKIRVCDVCHARKVMTETTKYLRFRNQATGASINIDVCDAHKYLDKVAGIRTTEQAIAWVSAGFPEKRVEAKSA